MAGIVSQTKVHLVLGAGGAKCIGYVGALREIENRGISYASVSACSAGTLIGAFLGPLGTSIKL